MASTGPSKGERYQTIIIIISFYVIVVPWIFGCVPEGVYMIPIELATLQATLSIVTVTCYNS